MPILTMTPETIPMTSAPLPLPSTPQGAVLAFLRFLETHPTSYAMAQEIVTTAMRVPQEQKGAYLNGVTRLFFTDDVEPKAWLTFRAKLQTLVLKAQALVQAGDMLLQDWHITDLSAAQLTLFAQTPPPVPSLSAPQEETPCPV